MADSEEIRDEPTNGKVAKDATSISGTEDDSSAQKDSHTLGESGEGDTSESSDSKAEEEAPRGRRSGEKRDRPPRENNRGTVVEV